MTRPNLLVILIDDLRFDEFGAGGHPYMKTPHIDRIANEGAICNRAFHTTPLCSPNRASIVTGQYASRHGIIDNVARDAHSHRLPNYHLALQKLGYETAHVGKWHMGNEGGPRPGYDHWVSFDGHGDLFNPKLNENGVYTRHEGYITDLLNQRAVDFVSKKRDRPFSLFFAHKAVHPDAFQAADGKLTLDANNGYKCAPRHVGLYKDAIFPPRPNVIATSEVVKDKPVWREAFEIKSTETSQALLESVKSGDQEEMRLRARMMASVDEGVGDLFTALEKTGELDNTFILFLGDNGYFFGEHGLGLERRFAYEEGIRSPFIFRYPPKVNAGTQIDDLILALDIAPTCIALAGGTPGAQIQGRSLVPLMGVPAGSMASSWRHSILCEYFSENAMPWLIGMSYKAIRTDHHKLIHWVNRGDDSELDELYDLDRDPYEMHNLVGDSSYAQVRGELRQELGRLVVESVGLQG